MVLVIEWESFQKPDFAAMKKKMITLVIFGGRNQYYSEGMADTGLNIAALAGE